VPVNVIVSVVASPRVVLPVAESVVNEPAAAVVPPIAGGEARYVEKPVPETVDEADKVVNAPVLGVVAPTVPLILMDAVPVRFVTVPDKGVPSAPPLTIKAPELPVFTPSAVTTPVPVVRLVKPPLPLLASN
jgi:hypothetical protein